MIKYEKLRADINRYLIERSNIVNHLSAQR